jgi:chemotaxis protein MotB
MKYLLILSAAAALLPGCIAKSKYLELEADYAGTKSSLEGEIERLKKTAEGLNGDLQGEQSARAAAEARIKTLEQALAEEQARLARLDREKAELLADKTKLKASVDDMTAALRELEKRRASAEARVAQFKDMLARFKKLIDAGTLQVKIVDGRMVVALATDILFDSGSASLSKPGKAAIEEVAAVLQSIPDREYQVEGHTDTVPISNAQYVSNWELASGRALTVVKAMIAAGLKEDRVSAASFGEWKPTAPNDTAENKAKNRRIEIVVVPDLSDLPGFEELQKTVSK